MKKQILFKVLLLSWLSGIFLICLFPPIPDIQVASESGSFISQESLPELHQRNTSFPRMFQFDLGMEFQEVKPFGFLGLQSDNFKLDETKKIFHQTLPQFDVKVFFKAFFETW